MTEVIRDDNESDDDDEQGEEAAYDGTLQRTGGTEEQETEEKDKKLQPVDIDAHWIQRAMGKMYDPNEAQKKAREVMEILRVSQAVVINANRYF
jgi:pre-mRNA-splicing helicase BRR2